MVLAARPIPQTKDMVADTVADIASLVVKDGEHVMTLGRLARADGGGKTYIKHSAGKSGVTIDSGFYVDDPSAPAGDSYLEAADKTTANVIAFQAFNNGSNATTTRLAIVAADGNGVPLYFPAGTYLLDASMTLTNHVIFAPGAVIDPGSGNTLTLNGGYTGADNAQVFDVTGGGTVTGDFPVIDAHHWGCTVFNSDPGAGNRTDSATQLQAMQNAAEANNLHCQLRKGIVYTESTITVTSAANRSTGWQGSPIHRNAYNGAGGYATVLPTIQTYDDTINIFTINNASGAGAGCIKFTNIAIRGNNTTTHSAKSGAGIHINDAINWTSRVTIDGCSIQHFRFGIRNVGPNGTGLVYIRDTTISSNYWGIYFVNQANNTTITDCEIRANGDVTAEADYDADTEGGGIWFDNGVNAVRITGCDMEGQSVGIRVTGGRGLTIDGCYFESNPTASIILTDVEGGSVTNCYLPLSFGTYNEIVIRECRNITVSGNGSTTLADLNYKGKVYVRKPYNLKVDGQEVFPDEFDGAGGAGNALMMNDAWNVDLNNTQRAALRNDTPHVLANSPTVTHNVADIEPPVPGWIVNKVVASVNDSQWIIGDVDTTAGDMAATDGQWLVISAWVYVPTGNTGNNGFLRYVHRYKLGAAAYVEHTGADGVLLTEDNWQLCRWVRRLTTTETVRGRLHFLVPTSGDTLYFCNAQVGVYDYLPTNPAPVTQTPLHSYEQLDHQTFEGDALPTDGHWTKGQRFVVDGKTYVCDQGGSPGQWVKEEVGELPFQYAVFSGSADIDVTDSTDFAWTDNLISIGLWARNDLTLPAATQYWVAKDQASNQEFTFYIDSSGRVEFVVSGDGGTTNYRYRSGSTQTDVSVWRHYAVTYDAPNTSCKFYIDGVLTSTVNVAGTTQTTIYDGTGKLEIGTRQDASRWDGDMRDIYLDNRIWTAAEAKKLANNGHFPVGVGHWDLRGGVTDKSGNGNDGTASNITYSWDSNDIDVLNVVDHFGATGDGVTDDTAAIQAAVDAANKDQPAKVFFPPGRYKLTSPIEMDSAMGVVIEGPNAPYYHVNTGEQIAVKIDVTGLAAGESAFHITDTANDWRGAGGNVFRGIMIHGDSGNKDVHGIHVEKDSAVPATNFWGNIELDNVFVIGCDAGLFMDDQAASGEGFGWIFVHNSRLENNAYGFRSNKTINHAVFRDNIIRQNTQGTPADIKMDGSHAAGIHMTGSITALTIDGNDLEGQSIGVLLSNAKGGQITGNYFESNPGGCILLNGCTHLLVEANRTSDTAEDPTTDADGAVVLQSCNHIVCRNNHNAYYRMGFWNRNISFDAQQNAIFHQHAQPTDYDDPDWTYDQSANNWGMMAYSAAHAREMLAPSDGAELITSTAHQTSNASMAASPIRGPYGESTGVYRMTLANGGGHDGGIAYWNNNVGSLVEGDWLVMSVWLNHPTTNTSASIPYQEMFLDVGAGLVQETTGSWQTTHDIVKGEWFLYQFYYKVKASDLLEDIYWKFTPLTDTEVVDIAGVGLYNSNQPLILPKIQQEWDDNTFPTNSPYNSAVELATGTYTLAANKPTEIDSSGGAVTGTLGSGDHVGQIKTVVMTDATNSSTVSVTNHETSDPEVFTFDALDECLVLVWTGTEWATIKATATT